MSDTASVTRQREPADTIRAALNAHLNDRSRPDSNQTALIAMHDAGDDALRRLSDHAIEPNAYHLPDWLKALSASARNRNDIDALCVWQNRADQLRLTATMPVVSLWRAYALPFRALVSAQPYGALGTPHIDWNDPVSSAEGLIQAARQAGAHALVLRDLALAGPAATAIREALIRQGLEAVEITSSRRALLDATQNPNRLLLDALGAKKLKELRRQKRRLEDIGPVRFDVARTRQDVRQAIETFLTLESSGWKGKSGTALARHDGDALFIRRATAALAARDQCEIATLHTGDTPLAAAIVLRHQDRAFTFKIGYDERFAKFSPGVQLVLDLTHHFCSDPQIASVDSTAVQDHPMISPIWRGRIATGDVLIQLRKHDPVYAVIKSALVARVRLRAMAKAVLRR